jgi:hypothetical protein
MSSTFRVIRADGEEPVFAAGESVRVSVRYPVGHYRVPRYVRGKRGVVEFVIEPKALNSEEEGFGRNAGMKRHYYRIAVPLTELWPDYVGSAHDELRIEVHESWLERG